ncbi:uncharacterized protein BDZ99DRAFT_571581 [Mytilinidion resinicola]|uniref:Rhodopsin domain-containing protein n=1 Tax=Mytilinidion resinicola TaxID=574789 RepID=A0A6A6YIK1_9PEZI|nr:uncharacterized protein BDZ99DRAFT_571581 [Mytilinidion resinicola]KAF2808682.1 hypothetical protein BDZ99DRAFT_571581 [Mytilinidion resinicola]
MSTYSENSPVAVAAVFAAIATISVTLRLFARRKKRLVLEWDDYSIVLALVCLLGLVACDIVGVVHGGVGLHVTDVVANYGPKPLTIFAKDLIAVQILWATSLMFTKTSILFFYTRIFTVPAFRLAARIIGGVVVLWALSVILCGFLLCRPFAFNWDQTIPNGHCGNQILSYELTGAFNICTDVMVLALPLPLIWNLQMRMANKIGLLGVFTVGFFVCVVSVVRLITLIHLSYSDITYSVPNALIWSMLEPAIGITLACLPVIRPLLGSGFSSLSKSKNTSEKTRSNFQQLDENYPLRSLGDSKRAMNVEVGSEHGSTREINLPEINVQHAIENTGPLDSHRMSQRDKKITVTQEFTQEWTTR